MLILMNERWNPYNTSHTFWLNFGWHRAISAQSYYYVHVCTHFNIGNKVSRENLFKKFRVSALEQRFSLLLQSHGLYCIYVVARGKGRFLYRHMHIAQCTMHIAQCTMHNAQCPWTGTTAEPVSQTLTVSLNCVLNYWNKRFKIDLLQMKALVSLFCCIFRK